LEHTAVQHEVPQFNRIMASTLANAWQQPDGSDGQLSSLSAGHDGDAVGCDVGREVGTDVPGEVVGVIDGLAVGCDEGDEVGLVVGVWVDGAVVGEDEDGWEVGCFVGETVGDDVGLVVFSQKTLQHEVPHALRITAWMSADS